MDRLDLVDLFEGDAAMFVRDIEVACGVERDAELIAHSRYPHDFGGAFMAAGSHGDVTVVEMRA